MGSESCTALFAYIILDTYGRTAQAFKCPVRIRKYCTAFADVLGDVLAAFRTLRNPDRTLDHLIFRGVTIRAFFSQFNTFVMEYMSAFAFE